ncbi:MAG: hypothetical protein ACP5P3_00970 [Ignavibacteria bacterium]
MQKNSKAQFVIAQKELSGNNIVSYFVNIGVFDQKRVGQQSAGFEWLKNSVKYAIFTAGSNISACIRGFFAMTSASYSGEYAPGYSSNAIAYKPKLYIKLHVVRRY